MVCDERTYHVDPIENETMANAVLHQSDASLTCGTERACALEERIVDEGGISFPGAYDPPFDRQPYEVVMIDSQWYVPEPRPGVYADELT